LPPAMSAPALILRRAQVRKRGESQPDDYDVFDGDRDVGRIYLVHAGDGAETWFWGVSFRIAKRKSYGYASTLEQASAAFRVEYERSQRVAEKPTSLSSSN
jgi:hypothetical protein